MAVTGDEGLIELVEDDSPELNAFLAEAPSVPALLDASSLPAVEEDWIEDNIPGKWDKIRSIFLNAKRPVEVRAAAEFMPINQWLDWAVKMAPKQPDVQGVRITAIRVELPPRDNQPSEAVVVEVCDAG